MKLLQKSFFLIVVCGMLFGFNSPKPAFRLTNEFITENLESAVKQYGILSSNVPSEVFPKTYLKENDSLVTSNSRSWTSGFYPGTLLYLYEFSNDKSLLEEAKRKLKVLEKEKLNTGTHDLGFMLYCSFGNAYRITKDPEYKSIMLRGAESLISRFNPTVGSIRSWDHNGDKWKYPVIIDNMMNLEFLNWASRETKDNKYKNISLIHSNTTLKNHFRKDFSSYHVIDYDPETGRVLNKHTHQGAAHESAWARGQAWALYGYTMMYRDTKDKSYLKQAINIADFIINHPNLPKDKIPYWDFDAENIPNTYRDASAAAIMSSALLELSTYAKNEKSRTYLEVAEKMIQSLSSEPYKNKLGSNGGFLLKHSTGHLPGGSEIDVPLSYADYYYVEALMRYKGMLN
jgi:rhamnogalacturonyl hydrolase YesR